jgi:hypothetical protein
MPQYDNFHKVHRNQKWGITDQNGFQKHLTNTVESLYPNTKSQIGTSAIRSITPKTTEQEVRKGVVYYPHFRNTCTDDSINVAKCLKNINYEKIFFSAMKAYGGVDV